MVFPCESKDLIIQICTKKIEAGIAFLVPKNTLTALMQEPNDFINVFRLEAVYCGCMPLAPNNLVYPEIYPSENLYNTKKQLIKKLKNWCQNVILFQKHRKQFYDNFKFQKFSSDTLVPKYMECLTISIQKDFDGITLAKQQRTSE